MLIVVKMIKSLKNSNYYSLTVLKDYLLAILYYYIKKKEKPWKVMQKLKIPICSRNLWSNFFF